MNNKTGKLLVIQGAQWGSEGKGQVAALVAEREGHAAVRTGSINAGHTVYYKDREYKMQTIPTAWVVKGMPLFIGPGAFIHPGILEREILEVSAALGEDIRERLFIDKRCFVHTPAAEAVAKKANRHVEMGATGKGSSEALIQKLRSRGNFKIAKALNFKNWVNYESSRRRGSLEEAFPAAFRSLLFVDVPQMLMDLYDRGKTIVFEGTQGSHLDLHLGPHPFVSNRGANAATWIQEAGLSPSLNVEVMLVARTFPIRVAGDSGPMHEEITWPMLWRSWNEGRETPVVDPLAIENYQQAMASEFMESAARPNDFHGDAARYAHSVGWNPHKWDEDTRRLFRHELSNVPMEAWKKLSQTDKDKLSKFIEMTTVTKKPRRIAKLARETLEQAILWNRPTRIFLGFANYANPDLWFEEDSNSVRLDPAIHEIIKDVIRIGKGEVEVCGFSTGPTPKHHLFC